MEILVLNAGSSSLKFAIYESDPQGEPELRLAGQIGGLPDAARLSARAPGQAESVEDWSGRGGDPLEGLLAWLTAAGRPSPRAVGHRIVHGGRDFVAPAVLDSAALTALEALVPLAPLHQPANLAAVRAASRAFPEAVQVGVFDTAFHATQPRLSRLYALPRPLIDEGVIAYGFHGLSYDYMAGRLGETFGPEAGGRVIVAHLGSGASLCALRRGKSQATTMGFSALDGPPMATRSGSIDPGVLLYLMERHGMDAQALSDLLYRRSGLLGVSGESGDIRRLLASQSPFAAEAVDLFVGRIVREVGGLAAELGGLDKLVFTAGIGENASEIRARIARGCAWLGAELDSAANLSGAEIISTAASAVELLVWPTDEQLVIARAALDMVGED